MQYSSEWDENFEYSFDITLWLLFSNIYLQVYSCFNLRYRSNIKVFFYLTKSIAYTYWACIKINNKFNIETDTHSSKFINIDKMISSHIVGEIICYRNSSIVLKSYQVTSLLSICSIRSLRTQDIWMEYWSLIRKEGELCCAGTHMVSSNQHPWTLDKEQQVVIGRVKSKGGRWKRDFRCS